MKQKEKIISLLQYGQVLTQCELSQAIYGDKKHSPNIYSALQSLVNSGAVLRVGKRPARYSLTARQVHGLPKAENASNDDNYNSIITEGDANTAELVIRAAHEYYSNVDVDKNGRYLSWQHCYSQFVKARKESSKDYDQLSLHLAFYLASWGMYRGSSFLLQKDYKVHIPIVKELLDPKYDLLLGIKSSALKDPSNLKVLKELGDAIAKKYESTRRSVDNKQNVGHGISSILITKVLLGTLGCVPAYDQYFVKGIKRENIASGTYSQKSIGQLADFYERHIDAFEECRANFWIKEDKLQYPQMKLLDMGFWQIGISVLE